MQVSFGFEWIDSLSCLFSTSHSLMKSSFFYLKKKKEDLECTENIVGSFLLDVNLREKKNIEARSSTDSK